ncbi:hypothetical protein BH23CHL7_BH23CHL7_05700 [soil metagenome]
MWRFDNVHRAPEEKGWVAELRAPDNVSQSWWVSRRPGATPDEALTNAVEAAYEARVWKEDDPDHYGPYKNQRS